MSYFLFTLLLATLFGCSSSSSGGRGGGSNGGETTTATHAGTEGAGAAATRGGEPAIRGDAVSLYRVLRG